MSIRNGKEAYKSPIETIWSDIEYDYVEQIDQMVLTAVQNVGIMVDKEELVKALAYDREQYRKGWEDRDAEIVRCKDCKHSEMNDELGLLMCHYRKCYHLVPEDGFCNFGEKR